MAVFRRLAATSWLNNQTRCLRTTSTLKLNPYEPEYLELLKPQVPVYNLLNFQVKGYDFTVLEHYEGHIHRIARRMDLNVAKAWATPNQPFKINTFKPQSISILSSYALKIYERNVQIENLPAWKIGTFVDMIQTVIPEGVTLSVLEHTQEIEEDLYIPDLELEGMRVKLDDLENPAIHGKKK